MLAGSIGGLPGPRFLGVFSFLSVHPPIDDIPYIIQIVNHLVDLRLVILPPVGFYWFFTLVLECPIPNTLYDLSLVPRRAVWRA